MMLATSKFIQIFYYVPQYNVDPDSVNGILLIR